MKLSENDHLWQPGAAKVHDKGQLGSLLFHPLLLPLSPWESETLSPSLLPLKGDTNLMHLSADSSCFLMVLGAVCHGKDKWGEGLKCRKAGTVISCHLDSEPGCTEAGGSF